MDMSFQRRDQHAFAERTVARLDYRIMLATVRALQAAAKRHAETASGLAAAGSPLVELLLAGTSWRGAVTAQGGCFNRRQADAAMKAPSTEMTSAFTFAFQPSLKGSRLSRGE